MNEINKIGYYTEIITDLSIARKNMFIYPDNHIQVKNSLTRVYKKLSVLFESEPEIHIIIMDKTLNFNEEQLDFKHAIVDEFTQQLKQIDVVSITLTKGLTHEELVVFLKILSMEPDEIFKQGGPEALTKAKKLPHAVIQAVDFEAFRLAQEDEISIPDDATDITSRKNIWQDYVTHLMNENISGHDQNMGPLSDPTQIADYLNRSVIDKESAVKLYDQIISDHINPDELTGKSQDAIKGAAEQLDTMIKDLNPDIRNQFLSATFNHSTMDKLPSGAESFLSGLSENHLMEMIHQASMEKRKISQSLINLVCTLTDIEKLPFSIENQKDRTTEKTDLPEEVFESEDYTHYVPEDYDDLLKTLIGQKNNLEDPDETEFSLDDHLKTLTEDHLDLQITNLLVHMTGTTENLEEYVTYTKRLEQTVVNLDLDNEDQFRLLLEIISSREKDIRSSRDNRIRKIAWDFLKQLRSREFIRKIEQGFRHIDPFTMNNSPAVFRFLGQDGIPLMVGLYLREKNNERKKWLQGILKKNKEKTALEAARQITALNSEDAGELVDVIKQIGDESAVLCFESLLSHLDISIQFQAMNILLHFRNNNAMAKLMLLLQTGPYEKTLMALELTGINKLTELVPEILEMIKPGVLTKQDYQLNKQIIQSLGAIGDPRSIPAFERLVRKKITLFPNELLKMKQTLFKNLDNFPPEAVAPLIELGINHRDEIIRLHSRKIIEKNPVKFTRLLA